MSDLKIKVYRADDRHLAFGLMIGLVVMLVLDVTLGRCSRSSAEFRRDQPTCALT